MQKYYIHEGNLERLQKQLKTIENKCKKYNLDFTFNVLEDDVVYREWVDDETGETHLAKFIAVEAEGSISHGEWSFVAVLEHSKEGTVIRNYNKDLEVPERYRNSPCRCEHCNTIRNRRDTYVIFNNDTQEFKQVGKSCLMEYTQGLSAEDVARYISMFESIIKGEAPSGRSSWTHYYDSLELVQYTIECVKHWGYTKHDPEEQQYADAPRSTRTRVMDYVYLDHGWTNRVEVRERLQAELDAVGFKHNSEENKVLAKEMIAWASAFDATSNNYMHNLKVVCRKDAVDRRDVGILLSLVPAYYKHINNIKEQEKKAAEQKAVAEVSKWVGQEGEKVTRQLKSLEHVYSGDSIYGPTYLYRMVDVDGNVLNWWTSSWLDLETQKAVSVTGTIKKLEEYRGIKQTVLIRCKLTWEKIEKIEKIEKEEKQKEGDENEQSFSSQLDDWYSVFNQED